MKKDYVCCVCSRQGVKLWRPYMNTEPLICAECAERRQSPREYNEVHWEKRVDRYIGMRTDKRLPLPRWKVNESGLVPSYDGPGPTGAPSLMTDQLIVNLKDVSKSYGSGETTMIPAIPDEDGEFWGYTSVPQKFVDWWKALPTR